MVRNGECGGARSAAVSGDHYCFIGARAHTSVRSLIDPALVGRRRGGSNVRDDDDAGGMGAGEVARGGGDGEEGEGEELAHFSDALEKC